MAAGLGIEGLRKDEALGTVGPSNTTSAHLPTRSGWDTASGCLPWRPLPSPYGPS
jgi:hypothetical protein